MIDSYIAVDVETTGLEVRQEKITELALVRVEGDTVYRLLFHAGQSRTAYQ